MWWDWLKPKRSGHEDITRPVAEERGQLAAKIVRLDYERHRLETLMQDMLAEVAKGRLK